ncbi:hypothetical protein ScPMuIL_008648 [Solemya velum]
MLRSMWIIRAWGTKRKNSVVLTNSRKTEYDSYHRIRAKKLAVPDRFELEFTMTERERTLSWMVPTSDEPCMIMCMDDEPRARMSCGHPMLPQSLYDYCLSQLKDGKTEFRCPHVGPPACNRIWHLTEIRLKACLNNAENSGLEEKLSLNMVSKDKDVRQCPNCMALSKRESTSHNRVRCRYCLKKRQKTDFCWACLKTWANEGTDYCGNPGCSSEEDTLAILRKCGTKKINDENNCPSRRACPKCGSIIEHIDKCSMMICPPCGEEFCFICLKITKYGHKPCNLVPRQTQLIKK